MSGGGLHSRRSTGTLLRKDRPHGNCTRPQPPTQDVVPMMAWIESHQSLGAHPKTKKLCRMLRLSKPEAIGYLHMLWWWAIDYAQDGDLTRYEPIDIALGAEWEGEEQTFVDGLIAAGFLERDENGLRIHDWYDYAGKLIERRARNAKRMREARADYDADTCETRATHVQRTLHARVQLPNRTVPNQPNLTNQPELETNSADAEVLPDEFVAFWKRYPKGRGSKPKSLAAWKKVRKEHSSIMAGLESWLRSEQWQRGMVKTCELWLRDRLWENPPEPPEDPMEAWMRDASVAPEHRLRAVR